MASQITEIYITNKRTIQQVKPHRCHNSVYTHTHTQFVFNRPIFLSYFRLGWCSKLNFWQLLWREVLQAGCPLCRLLKSSRALKDDSV